MKINRKNFLKMKIDNKSYLMSEIFLQYLNENIQLNIEIIKTINDNGFENGLKYSISATKILSKLIELITH